MVKRNLIISPVAKAVSVQKSTFAASGTGDVLDAVKEIEHLDDETNLNAFDIPKGQYLYGIKLKTGEYHKVVAENLIQAAYKLKVDLSDIKRGMPIHYGG